MRKKWLEGLHTRHRIMALATRFSGRGINEVDSLLASTSKIVVVVSQGGERSVRCWR